MTFLVGMEVLVCQGEAIQGRAKVVKKLANGNVRVQALKDPDRSYWHKLQFRASDGYRAGGNVWNRTNIVALGSDLAKEMLLKRHRRIVRGKLEALAIRFANGNLSQEAVTAIEEVVARFE